LFARVRGGRVGVGLHDLEATALPSPAERAVLCKHVPYSRIASECYAAVINGKEQRQIIVQSVLTGRHACRLVPEC
jgi:hypothetical protein